VRSDWQALAASSLYICHSILNLIREKAAHNTLEALRCVSQILVNCGNNCTTNSEEIEVMELEGYS